MLSTLRIKNLALVEDLTIEFQPGCNVITGETGAGKSVLLGALSLVLGERASRTLIRAGADSCTVEAVFQVSGLRAPLKAFLDDNGLEPCEEDRLLLKRSFSAAGATRQFVNGSPSTLAQLEAIGEWLVDVHGPHDHQSLLHPSRQLDILDAFGGLEAKRAAFTDLARQRAALESEKAALVVDEATYARELDLLRFQTGEISAARLQPGEEEPLQTEYQRASNAARLLEITQAALNRLAEDEDSLMAQAGAIGRLVQDLHKLDATAAPLSALHDQMSATARELHHEISRYADKVEIDPERLRELEERLNLLHSLKRKYGASVDDVIAFGEEAARKLGLLEGRDAELARLNTALDALDVKLTGAGRVLTSERRKVIPRLAKAAMKQLDDLGFRQSRFDAVLQTGARTGPAGFDTVEFQFAPNPGEPARPLRAIASSGEMARVMLALKTVLAAEDEIPVLVFDEVDANVGGETAHAVGEKMRHLGRHRQVLCVTHLPQVAAQAQAHFEVTKENKGGRTVSRIRLLSDADRVTELARMLGGQSAEARKHAEAMMRHP